MSTGFKGPLVHGTASNQAAYGYRSGFGLVESAEWKVVFDDFDQFITGNVPTGWTADVIDTGATAVTSTTEASAVEIGSDGTTEGTAIYLPLSVKLDGKKCLIETRVKTTDADDTDVQFGLSVLTAVTNPEDVWTTAAADLIAFGVLDGDATVTMLCDKDNSGSSAELGTIDLADDTWHTLAIVIEGNGTDSSMSCKGYVDGKLALTWSTETTIPEDLLLAPFIGGRTGGDAAHVVNFDYLRIVQAR